MTYFSMVHVWTYGNSKEIILIFLNLSDLNYLWHKTSVVYERINSGTISPSNWLYSDQFSLDDYYRQRPFQAMSCHTKTMAMTEMMDPFVPFLLFVLCNSLNDLINSILQSGDRSALSGSEVTVRGQRLNLVFKLKTLQNAVGYG